MRYFAENIDANIFPKNYHHLLALLGSSYSNYNQTQNFVNDEYLSPTNPDKNVVDWLYNGLSDDVINTLIPEDDPLSIINEDLALLIDVSLFFSLNTLLICF